MGPLLSDLKIRETGTIESYVGESSIQSRLKELGLVAGTKVKVKRFAPLGDPMEIEIRGYNLSIRKEDAKQIIVRRGS